MRKKVLSISFAFTLIITKNFAQNITATNIHHRIIENKIEIFYDLPNNRDTINVQVFFHKKSNPKFVYQPKYVNGNIGVGVYSGANKKIVWQFKKEPSYLFTGSNFYFIIKAKRQNKAIQL